MQETKYSELETRASHVESADMLKQLEARVRIGQEIEKMRAEGSALTLTEEEINLLGAFRRFKSVLNGPGKFKWSTEPAPGVQIVQETGLIAHPNEEPSIVQPGE